MGGAGTRADRVTHALAEMGVSIFSAFLTTWTAAMVLLLFTTVTFFTEFGIFLAICMVCSVVVSLMFFPAMLSLAGPLPPTAGASLAHAVQLQVQAQGFQPDKNRLSSDTTP